MSFVNMLNDAWKKTGSLVCVGLDADPRRIPPSCRNLPNSVFEFNKAIIDATADLVCAYKPQAAFYSAFGVEAQLKMTIEYVHKHAPGIPVILDAKRGDIGNTAAMYAVEAFDRYEADAVTVNPFLGGDSLTPFLERANKGIIILCRTSNPGAVDIQNFSGSSGALYMHIAEMAAGKWNANNNVCLVVGGTYPEDLAKIRAVAGDIPLLVPGIGAQGGDVAGVVKAGMDSKGAGMIINSSRNIIYAGQGPDFANMARKAAVELRNLINMHRPAVRF